MGWQDIEFEGLRGQELVNLSVRDVDDLLFHGQELAFQVGTAQVLARFALDSEALTLELGPIDGGGERVLPAIAALARHFASQRGLPHLQWFVHAVTCAQPSAKLQRKRPWRSVRTSRKPGMLIRHGRQAAPLQQPECRPILRPSA